MGRAVWRTASTGSAVAGSGASAESQPAISAAAAPQRVRRRKAGGNAGHHSNGGTGRSDEERDIGAPCGPAVQHTADGDYKQMFPPSTDRTAGCSPGEF